MVSDKISLSKERINLVVGYTDVNRYIAYRNDLPWKRALRADLKFINKLIRIEPNTSLIMGRKTFESMPKIRDVEVIVITSQSIESDGVKLFKSVDEAIQYCRKRNMFIVIFGGSRIYEEAMKHTYRLFCTVVREGSLPGDRTFPESKVCLENISKHVHMFLLSNGVEKTWNLNGDEDSFEENGFSYKFCMGESGMDAEINSKAYAFQSWSIQWFRI